MGYANRLTGHGIRGTLSTALNEIGYLLLPSTTTAFMRSPWLAVALLT
jgi:hypothetical protein